MKKKTRVKRVFLTVLALLIFLVVMLRVALPSAVLWFVNNRLCGMLGAETTLEAVDISLMRGMVEFRGFVVAQPAGFAGGPLLSVEKGRVQLDFAGVPQGRLFLSFSGERVFASLVRAGDGALNIQALLPGSTNDAPAEVGAGDNSVFSFALKHFSLVDTAFCYEDNTAASSVCLTNLNIAAGNLKFFQDSNGASNDMGALDITGELVQPGDSNAELLITAGIAPIAGSVPDINFELILKGVLDQFLCDNLPDQFALLRGTGPFSFKLNAGFGEDTLNASFSMLGPDGKNVVSFDNTELDFGAGTGSLQSLFVSAPERFGKEPLVRLAELSFAVDMNSLTGSPMVVNSVVLKKPEINPGLDPNGLSVLDVVFASGPDDMDADSAVVAEGSAPFAILLEQFELSDGSGFYAVKDVDEVAAANDEETMRIALTNINVFATNLFAGADSSAYENGAGGFSAFVSLRQESLPDALLSVSGTLTPWIPSVDLSFAVKGFDPSVAGLKIPARDFEGWDDKVFDFTGNILFANDVFEGNVVFKNASGRPIVSFGKVYLSMAEKSVLLSDVSVLQPSGFGSGVMCSVAEIAVNAELGQALTPLLRIKEMRAKQPRLFLVKNRDGIKNRDFFFYSAGDETPAAKVDNGSGTVPDVENKEGMTAVLETFYLENMEFRYEDNAVDVKNPLVIHATNINMSATNIVYSRVAGSDDGLPGTISLTGSLVQRRGHDGFFGFFAETGLLSAAYPSLNAALRVVGLELDTISTLIPAGSSKAIGGDALDVSADIAVAPEMLDVRLKGKTVKGHTLPLLSLGGTPSEPDIRVSKVVLGIVSRLGGTVGNVARNITDASKDVAGSAVRTTVSVGRAALQTVVSIGKGVFKTAHGVATADGSKVVGGLKETTMGTASEAFVTIYDITDDLMDDAAGAASSGIGRTQSTEWRENNFKRWENDWIQAVKKVRDMPYPPERGEPDASFLSR